MILWYTENQELVLVKTMPTQNPDVSARGRFWTSASWMPSIRRPKSIGYRHGHVNRWKDYTRSLDSAIEAITLTSLSSSEVLHLELKIDSLFSSYKFNRNCKMVESLHVTTEPLRDQLETYWPEYDGRSLDPFWDSTPGAFTPSSTQSCDGPSEEGNGAYSHVVGGSNQTLHNKDVEEGSDTLSSYPNSGVLPEQMILEDRIGAESTQPAGLSLQRLNIMASLPEANEDTYYQDWLRISRMSYPSLAAFSYGPTDTFALASAVEAPNDLCNNARTSTSEYPNYPLMMVDLQQNGDTVDMPGAPWRASHHPNNPLETEAHMYYEPIINEHPSGQPPQQLTSMFGYSPPSNTVPSQASFANSFGVGPYFYEPSRTASHTAHHILSPENQVDAHPALITDSSKPLRPVGSATATSCISLTSRLRPIASAGPPTKNLVSNSMLKQRSTARLRNMAKPASKKDRSNRWRASDGKKHKACWICAILRVSQS